MNASLRSQGTDRAYRAFVESQQKREGQQAGRDTKGQDNGAEKP